MWANLLLVFVVMCASGGLGGAIGGAVGGGIAHGGAIAGGTIGATAAIVASGYLASRRGWLTRRQRGWAIGGGVLGLVVAGVVTLSMLSLPAVPVFSTAFIGAGAILAAQIGRGPKRVRQSRRVRT